MRGWVQRLSQILLDVGMESGSWVCISQGVGRGSGGGVGVCHWGPYGNVATEPKAGNLGPSGSSPLDCPSEELGRRWKRKRNEGRVTLRAFSGQGLPEVSVDVRAVLPLGTRFRWTRFTLRALDRVESTDNVWQGRGSASSCRTTGPVCRSVVCLVGGEPPLPFPSPYWVLAPAPSGATLPVGSHWVVSPRLESAAVVHVHSLVA